MSVEWSEQDNFRGAKYLCKAKLWFLESLIMKNFQGRLVSGGTPWLGTQDVDSTHVVGGPVGGPQGSPLRVAVLIPTWSTFRC